MPHVKHPKNQNALLLSEILPLSENFGLVPTTIFSKEGWWHCCRFFPCWGTSKVNMQWGGNCWSICLGVAESIEEKERGCLSSCSPFMYAAQAEASTFSISRKMVGNDQTVFCLMQTQIFFSSMGFVPVSLRAGFGLVSGSILRCSWWYVLRGRGECKFPAGRQPPAM